MIGLRIAAGSRRLPVRSPPGVLLILTASMLGAASCDEGGDRSTLFELLSPETTGIRFVNELPEEPGFNILNYLYYYNGGGVAAGDVDGDGLPDLYFTSNLGPDRLYRNLGDYRFEDFTERAGIADEGGWTTGVTMADVNGDGHLDLYVSAVSYLAMGGRSRLWINDGDGTFTDRTETWGLGREGYATQAVFFDYDADGDLDAYLLNHSTHTERGVSSRPQREGRHPRAGDRLLRNDGERFVDVSDEAGIYGGVEGYGLGVVASDLNLDGCPDLFVANDFQENDFLYYNDCDGSFTESIATATGHTSQFSMGVDAADVNNDGRPDLMVLDMLPEREDILKTSHNADNFNVYELKVKAGYHPQYARNTLQLNRGGGRFSDIGFLAGVHATDWSWAPLLADLDNDGSKDLFVTNGIFRRPNDLDYINYVGNEAIQASLAKGITEENLTLLERMPQVPLPNYAFRNNGDLTFTNVAEAWGLARPGFSNGAVYVDLNDSGALDLVVNNVNAPATIYRNRSREVNGHHFLTVVLRGSGANTGGIGTKVMVKHDTTRQMLEQNPTRGFQSSVDPRLHFGLGTSDLVDSLVVVWPDRRFQVLTDLPVDRQVTLSQDEAPGRWAHGRVFGGAFAGSPAEDELAETAAAKSPGGAPPAVSPSPEPPLHATGPGPVPAVRFTDVTDRLAIDFVHEENTFYDYNREPFMPHKLSTEGPALATRDVNGDGLDDLYVGGAKHQPGKLFLQLPGGGFRAGGDETFRADSLHEDVDAVFFDADGDGDEDLYVVSSGNEFWGEAEALRDRLYLGDGTGGFRRSEGLLPDFFENGSCVVPGDFDGDGDVDLFVGSRVVSREYGHTPRSHLLENDGGGRFQDITAERAPSVAEAGMVTSAAWLDYDDDGQLDLVVVGEWMPVRVFRQEDRHFVERTAETGFAGTNGWWNRVEATDVTGDGREDLVLGNLGLNSYLRASPEEPARLYVHDFAENGALQQILTFYKNGVSYPLVGRDEVVSQIPRLRSRYVSYADFGASRIEDIFPASQLGQAQVLEAKVFASSLAVDDGDGTFSLRPLPTEAQFAPIYALLADDFDRDGHTDVLAAGNFDGVTPMRGRYDASYGLLLRGDGAGHFEAMDMEESGLLIEGQVRSMGFLRRPDGERLIAVARNGDRLQILHPQP